MEKDGVIMRIIKSYVVINNDEIVRVYESDNKNGVLKSIKSEGIKYTKITEENHGYEGKPGYKLKDLNKNGSRKKIITK